MTTPNECGRSRMPAPARHACFLALCLLAAAPFRAVLATLVKLSLGDERYGHLALMPLFSAGLVWLDQEKIFRGARACPALGAPAALAAILFCTRTAPADAAVGPDSLSFPVLAMAVTWIGIFVLCYGIRALERASYAAAFLLLTAPVPAVAVERMSAALQAGSADIAHWLFRFLGIPVFRRGSVFSLPGVSIEIAEACSGIRSTTALLIGSALMGRLFLDSRSRRAAFLVFTAGVGVFKNAVRIVALAGLGAYVDPGLLHGPLHHRYGGIVFSTFALGLLVPALLALRRSERRAGMRVIREASAPICGSA